MKSLILWIVAACLVVAVLYPTYDTRLEGMGEQAIESRRAWIWNAPVPLTDLDHVHRRDGETVSVCVAIAFIGITAAVTLSQKK